MAERNNRLNKPISDDMLYAAGMPRDIPDKEPVPPPPPVQPKDFDATLPGIEYRAMADVAPPASDQRLPGAGPEESQGNSQSPFAWLAQRRTPRS
ncbi:MAG: hypothetical protein KIT87_02335 [Anaerolineae bacterium]|nr:hypothetical protein [Anaerolineae bacterium]